MRDTRSPTFRPFGVERGASSPVRQPPFKAGQRRSGSRTAAGPRHSASDEVWQGCVQRRFTADELDDAGAQPGELVDDMYPVLGAHHAVLAVRARTGVAVGALDSSGLRAHGRLALLLGLRLASPEPEPHAQAVFRAGYRFTNGVLLKQGADDVSGLDQASRSVDQFSIRL